MTSGPDISWHLTNSWIKRLYCLWFRVSASTIDYYLVGNALSFQHYKFNKRKRNTIWTLSPRTFKSMNLIVVNVKYEWRMDRMTWIKFFTIRFWCQSQWNDHLHPWNLELCYFTSEENWTGMVKTFITCREGIDYKQTVQAPEEEKKIIKYINDAHIWTKDQGNIGKYNII